MARTGLTTMAGAVALLALSGMRADAQSSPSVPADMPASYRPPPGMCRVWLKDVPPMQQPAPTDCRTALRTRPADAVVVFGPDGRKSSLAVSAWTTRSEFGDEAGRGRDEEEALPAMRAALQWIEGQRPADLVRWFGSRSVAARFSMPAPGKLPERVQWHDQDGHLVQLWIDRNGDGRADRVELYDRDGARVKVLGN
ncbi:MAG: hypothetical protein MUF40_06640 [Gemmatimonadaceae bacterium]|nr:hypothetical protein [Gemmatimonadaceae bacterium]